MVVGGVRQGSEGWESEMRTVFVDGLPNETSNERVTQ